jgi:multisubunit Na+/H+ antiporter MnhE subunit
VQSNIIIALDILTPKNRINPDFLQIPLFLQSNFGLLLFSNLVSMTPGTLSVDIIDNKKILLVHVLYNNNNQQVLDELEKLQKKIKRIVN